MNAVIGIEELNNLKSEFKAYLQGKNPQWSESVVSTVATDAFFAFGNNLGVDFWGSFVGDELLLVVYGKICNYLAKAEQSEITGKHIEDYWAALQQLKLFLNQNHPSISTAWKGRSISIANLQLYFQAWMKRQKKPNGEIYSQSTISSYTTALKSTTARLLGLGDTVHLDLFLYISVEDFQIARSSILSAQNFEEVNVNPGHRAYSSAMIMYLRFLKEFDEAPAWIFQGNLQYYDIVGAIENLGMLTWAVNQYKSKIKSGDRVYIWLSGSEGGIIATGRIMCEPKMCEPNLNDPYNCQAESNFRREPYLGVDIQFERRFTIEKITRDMLLADERASQLGIFTNPRGTNFFVAESQKEAIESIIEGKYKQFSSFNRLKRKQGDKHRYWMYSFAEQACLWDEFYNQGIIGIGWDGIGDLTQFGSEKDIKDAIHQTYNTIDPDQNAHGIWRFANDIQIGDIVFVKKGYFTVFGRGVVESDYIFDEERAEYKNVRKVKWLEKGEWKHLERDALKVLTDITQYTDDVKAIEDMILSESEIVMVNNEPKIQYPDYSKTEFLNEVYISKEQYNILKGLLLRKRNVILQGAPGVGKTFAAQRLAFSIIGEKDTNRVKILQFHQSYSYEDFVMGYRPDGNGFKLVEGPFYRFCESAERDKENSYFFIIDEINRGNLSKIFGELLMLIDGDKRDESNAIRLLYKDEQFFVPPNVYIIGMMNTADRSLAMIDYALRRRFSFYDMQPAFQSAGFKLRQSEIQNPKFDKLVETVETLNKSIAEDVSLGVGFCIGHSYFCMDDTVDDEWLFSLIEYELIPLLNEYWFDEPSKVEHWGIQLRGVLNG